MMQPLPSFATQQNAWYVFMTAISSGKHLITTVLPSPPTEMTTTPGAQQS